LYQNPENKKYRLSPKILKNYSKGNIFFKWKELAQKHMLSLNEMCSESVNLAIRDANRCLYIELVPAKHVLQPNFSFNDYYYLHATGIGKCLLSGLSDEAITQLLPSALEPLTPNTITNRKTLIDAVHEVRHLKYARDNEEFIIGMHCIAAPVFGIGESVIAAVSITAPTIRMSPEKMNNLVPSVILTAQKISEEFRRVFGYY
jgi:DNA-binding IclR family transcriptional regulator